MRLQCSSLLRSALPDRLPRLQPAARRHPLALLPRLLLLLALILVPSLSRAQSYAITVGNVSGLYGDMVSIPIHVDHNNAPLANQPLHLSFFINNSPFYMGNLIEGGLAYNLTTDGSGNAAYPLFLDYTLPPNISIMAAVTVAADQNHTQGTGTVFVSLAGAPPVSTQTQDVTFTFQTADQASHVSNLQSMWNATSNAGFQASYFIGSSGFGPVSASGNGYVNPCVPAITILGVEITPAYCLGETGGAGSAFVKGGQNGLNFQAIASDGNVSINYPIVLHVTTPKYIAKGDTFGVHVTYNADYTGTVQTTSPTLDASVSLQMSLQAYAHGTVKLFGDTIFDAPLLDLTDHRDPQAPTYDPNATILDNHSVTANKAIVDVVQALNTLQKSVATLAYPDAVRPYLSVNMNIPQIATSGSPGSSLLYTEHSGGTSNNTYTYFEYTPFITVPDAVKNNPNASYARGYDDLIQLTGDLSNFIAVTLEEADIPFPPLRLIIPFGPVAFESDILDLYAQLGLGFLQEFYFIPKPMVYFADDSNPNIAPIAVEIDPVNGADFTFTMPQSGTINLTPHVTFNNTFTNTTYYATKGGLYFNPLREVIGPKSTGSNDQSSSLFEIDPFPTIGVQVDVPVQIYTTTFTIPFADQDGQAIALVTRDLPLAHIKSAYPPLSYYRENAQHGVVKPDVTFYAETVTNLDGSRAAPFTGKPHSLDGTLTGFTYYASLTDVFPSFTASPGNIAPGGAAPLYDELTDSLGNNTKGFDYGAGLYAYKAPLTTPYPGIHTIYSASTATNTLGGVTQTHGPLRTSIQYPVAYPTPHIDAVGLLAVDPFNHYAFTPFAISTGNKVGPIIAGSPGFLLAARDNASPLDVGSYSVLKIGGKALFRPVLHTSVEAISPFANPIVWGQIPPSLIARAGDYPVVITNPNDEGAGGDSNTFLLHVVNPKPTISGVTFSLADPKRPLNAVVVPKLTAGGPNATLIIAGTKFVPDAKVWMWRGKDTSKRPGNAVELTSSNIYVNPTQLTLNLPATKYDAAGDYILDVENPVFDKTLPDGGAATQVIFVHEPTPTITGLDDGINSAASLEIFPINSGDTTLTVHGKNFQNADATLVALTTQATLNGRNIATTFVDTHTLKVTIPANLLTHLGDLPFALVNRSDQLPETAISQPYVVHVVYPAPAILTPPNTRLSLDPPAQVVGQTGNSLTVNGLNFFPSSRVTMGGLPTTTTYVDATHLKAAVPDTIAATAGLYDVVVTTPKSRDFGPHYADGGVSNAVSYKVSTLLLRAQIKVDAQLARISFGFITLIQASITLTNVGNTDAQSVLTTSTTLNGAMAQGLNDTPGVLSVNASKTLVVWFPASLGTPGQNAVLAVGGTTAGSAFSSTQRVKLP